MRAARALALLALLGACTPLVARPVTGAANATLEVGTAATAGVVRTGGRAAGAVVRAPF